MTDIKLSCVIRHATKDYQKLAAGLFNAAIYTLVGLTALLAFITIGYVTMDSFLWVFGNAFVLVCLPHAWFIAISCIVLYRAIGDVSLNYTKDSFFKTRTMDSNGNKIPETKMPMDTWDVVFDATGAEGAGFFFTWAIPFMVNDMAGNSQPMKDALLMYAAIFAAVEILLVVFVPIACAIAKCRGGEE